MNPRASNREPLSGDARATTSIRVMARFPYPVLCTLLGLVLGWLPRVLHGPHPAKFNILFIRGSLAVWGYYTARMLIGFLVGVTCWPRQWYLRGPLCGIVILLPLGIVALATPGCGWP